ncbi:hypothetical protein HPB49_011213 [Dermacentor silvarum]|uniref:Uncharacterized protein n=1 Tax=Dermacentor silvarum TaxID=543639 RepID=A0ACB8C398_DERSI|nr:hypothetical protein HPB49_011213 [Dermacentor silvarum]
MEGKSAAGKFWTYVRGPWTELPPPPPPPPPPLIDATTRQPVTELQEYLTRHFSRVFGPPNMDDDCRQCDEIRDLWKLVHVPGLTFANAVTCLSPATREWLERQQREAGRTALGCHGHVANEAVQGDVGWSSF